MHLKLILLIKDSFAVQYTWNRPKFDASVLLAWHLSTKWLHWLCKLQLSDNICHTRKSIDLQNNASAFWHLYMDVHCDFGFISVDNNGSNWRNLGHLDGNRCEGFNSSMYVNNIYMGLLTWSDMVLRRLGFEVLHQSFWVVGGQSNADNGPPASSRGNSPNLSPTNPCISSYEWPC